LINVAVVGLGKMGLSHLAMVNGIDKFRVVAMCDSSTMVGGVLEKYSGIRYVSKFEDVIAIEDLDAVVIATPTVTHEPMVRAALERGLHVFCEKPLSLSPLVSEQLAALATEKGLVAQVGYHNRFIGTFMEVKRLIASGALGEVRHVLAEAYGPVVVRRAKPTWRSKAGQGGGCLYDYAAHPLNLLNWYFGRPEAVTSAALKTTLSAEVDDEVYAMLGFPGGITSQVSVNWTDTSVRKMSTRISIWGEAGKIYADRQEIQVFLNGNAPIPEGYDDGWTVKYITDLTPPVSFYLRGEEYSAQLEGFARAVEGVEGALQNSFDSSADTDATIDMIRRAAGSEGAVGRFSAEATPQKSGGVLARVFGR
jgi:scyllo-inositol 2-dehydrogenase (NADP+)